MQLQQSSMRCVLHDSDACSTINTGITDARATADACSTTDAGFYPELVNLWSWFAAMRW